MEAQSCWNLFVRMFFFLLKLPELLLGWASAASILFADKKFKSVSELCSLLVRRISGLVMERGMFLCLPPPGDEAKLLCLLGDLCLDIFDSSLGDFICGDLTLEKPDCMPMPFPNIGLDSNFGFSILN